MDSERAGGPAVLDRRQSLAQAALEKIAEKGLEGLRLRDVAAAVGIDHSTIHHYFATKEDLLAAVADLATRPFWESSPHDGTARERLERHLDLLAAMIASRPELYAVLRELDLRAGRDPKMAAIIDAREDSWRKVLLDVFEEGMPSGAWAEGLEPSGTVELTIATVKGASLRPKSARRVIAQLARLLIRSSSAS